MILILNHNENANIFLEREPAGKLMIRYAVPLIVSLLVAALYNIVDQIFIANASYLGSNGNAANNVVFPMTVIALAFTLMIGDGVCAFVSMSLGARNYKRAGDSVGSAAMLSAACGIIIAAVYYVLRDELLAFFGGRVNDETFRLAREYFSWIIPGIPFYVFGQAMNPVISADGSPNYVMFSTLCGALINIILDPLFIFGFHWGMTGAALATITGQIFTALMSVLYISQKMKAVKFSRSNLGCHPQLMKKYLPLGMCSFLSQVSLVVSVAAVNLMIKKYGALDPVFGQPEYSQIPMAVIGIVMKFFQIVISIVVGLSASCTPITGFNMGAGRPDRVRELFTLLLKSEVIIGVFAFIIVEFFPSYIADLFGASGESVYYAAFTVRCFRVYLCLIVLACVNKASFIFIQAMGRAWTSAGLSVTREVIFGAGLTVIMPVFMGLEGVLWSMPASDALTFIVSVIVIAMIYRELDAPLEASEAPAAPATLHEVPELSTAPLTPHEVMMTSPTQDTPAAPTTPHELAMTSQAQDTPATPQAPHELTTTPAAPATPHELAKSSLPVIVIGRSFGSGGRTVGRNLAHKLSIPYYDKEILTETAKASGISEQYLETVDETPASQALRGTSPFNPENIALKSQSDTIRNIALKGACVIVGRRADHIARGEGLKVLSVFVTSGMTQRTERVAQRDKITPEQAMKKIAKADKERAEFYNALSDSKWGDALSYDLCVDTGTLGIDGAVEIIAMAAEKMK